VNQVEGVQYIPLHQASVKQGWECAKQGLYEIAKGIFKWVLILGLTWIILF
jgi:hypothetical protein